MVSRKSARKSPSKVGSKVSVVKKVAGQSSERAGGFAHLSGYAFAYALAIVCALKVLVISLLGLAGKATAVVDFMSQILFSYSLKPMGIIAGMAEAAIGGLIGGFLLC